MARRNRRRVDPSRPTSTGGVERYENWRGERYAVRSVTGSAAAKDYRCPGCNQLVRAGQPHVVTWPADDLDASDRRHWHTACWTARRSPSGR